MSFDRKHIAEQLVLQASKIHPAFCIGQSGTSNDLSKKEKFALSFFLNCSDKELERLNDLAKSKLQCKEILIEFSIKKSGINSILSYTDMETFVFSEHSWIAKFLKEEVLTVEISQSSKATLMVIFS